MMDETLLRLIFLLSDQLTDIQKNRNSIKDSNRYLEAYKDVLNVIGLLQKEPTTKFICHEGRFWLEEEIDKRYYRNKYELK